MTSIFSKFEISNILNMQTEARKMQVIEEVIKLESEEVLSAVENILKLSTIGPEKVSPFDFSGTWTTDDIALAEDAIAKGCEQIDQDDWK